MLLDLVKPFLSDKKDYGASEKCLRCRAGKADLVEKYPQGTSTLRA